MRIVYKLSEKKYKNNQGVEVPYKNYFLELDNGRLVAIRPVFSKEYIYLSAYAIKYENKEN